MNRGVLEIFIFGTDLVWSKKIEQFFELLDKFAIDFACTMKDVAAVPVTEG